MFLSKGRIHPETERLGGMNVFPGPVIIFSKEIERGPVIVGKGEFGININCFGIVSYGVNIIAFKRESVYSSVASS